MEKDLFLPIKEYFESFGYICDGEVNGIDMYMEKNTENVAVELKQNLDYKAISQAALRQKVVDTVYIGIFKPTNLRSSSFKDKLYLLKRLGIGLIVVSRKNYTVDILSQPEPIELSSFKKRNRNRKKSLSTEFNKRKLKNNIGGVNKTKLITSYREDALLVLAALSKLGGEAKTSVIREICKVDKTTQILYNNYYGWFSRSGKGVYKIEDAGIQALKTFENEILLLNKGND